MPVLGVDGGNTKTVAVVATETGEILAAARGGTTDVYGTPTPEAALDELHRVVAAALRAASVAPDELRGAAFSLAGADWEEDYALHRATAARHLPGVPTLVVNDAIGPLRCAAPDGVGAALVCGTGPAIGARGPAGHVWHLSFSPRPGGASGLAEEALAAVQEADLGCGPETALTVRLLHAVGVAEPRELVHALTRRGPRPDVAALAPVVLATAVAGDEVARAIVTTAGRRMGAWTRHAARRVGLPAGHPLLLAGGLLRAPGHELLLDAALAELPDAAPLVLTVEPVVAAVLLALDAAAVVPDEPALLASAQAWPDLALPRRERGRVVA